MNDKDIIVTFNGKDYIISPLDEDRKQKAIQLLIKCTQHPIKGPFLNATQIDFLLSAALIGLQQNHPDITIDELSVWDADSLNQLINAVGIQCGLKEQARHN